MLKFFIRCIVKVILFPITLILEMIIWNLLIIFGACGIFFVILSIGLVIVTIFAISNGDYNEAIFTLISGFIFSPYGLPRIGILILCVLHIVLDFIKSI